MICSLSAEHTITRSTRQCPPPLPAGNLLDPVCQREAPVTGNQCSAEDVDHLDQENKEAVPMFDNVQQDRLDVVLEKDAGDGPVIDLVSLFRNGILVGEQCFRPDSVGMTDTVGCGHDREEVLELVEGRRSRVDGAVQRVDEGGQERTEGELVDDVGEVERYRRSVCLLQSMREGVLCSPEWSKCAPASWYPCPRAVI